MSFLARVRPARGLAASRTLLESQKRTFFGKKKCPPVKDACKAACPGGESGSAAASTEGEIPIGYKLLKNTQAKFQVKDDNPVWLKGGPTDRTMYLATCGLAVFGLTWSLGFIATHILTT